MKWHLLSGAGNRFAVLDGFVEPLPPDPAQLARELCGPGSGLDGLLLALPPSEGGACRMVVYNADGSRPEMCGNGLRCVAKLAVEHGHVDAAPFVIETDAGPRLARVELRAGRVVMATIHMGRPVLVERAARLEVDGRAQLAALVEVGNPHCVLFVDDVERAPVESLGPRLERHARFPRGTNVEFLELGSARARLRVWERGVGETAACGSGACAAAFAAVAHGLAQWPVTLELPGGTLRVDHDGAGGVLLTGPVESEGSRSC